MVCVSLYSTPVCLYVLQRAVPHSEDAANWGLSLKELAAGRSFRTRGSSQVSQGPLCVVHCVCVCVCVCVSVCVGTRVYGGGHTCVWSNCICTFVYRLVPRASGIN